MDKIKAAEAFRAYANNQVSSLMDNFNENYIKIKSYQETKIKLTSYIQALKDTEQYSEEIETDYNQYMGKVRKWQKEIFLSLHK